MTANTTRTIACPTCGAEAGKSCVSVKAGKPMHDDHAARRLLSLREAAAMGVERLRRPIWANRMDHVKIDIVEGDLGPWLHLFAPFNQECNGRDPVDMLWALGTILPIDDPEFERYHGPLPSSDEYRQEAARFAGVLAD